MLHFYACDLTTAKRLQDIAADQTPIEILGAIFVIASIEYKTNIGSHLEAKVDLRQILHTSIDATQQERTDQMNRSTTVFLINKDIRAFTAIYEDGHKAEYFKTFDQTLKKDDLVVVESGTRHNFTVVKVVDPNASVDIQDNDLKVKWMVSKIDLTEHKEILGNENDAVEKVKQAEFNKMRRDLMANMVNPEDADAIRALPIYKNGAPADPKPVA